MKFSDVEQLKDSGLISEEQRKAIVEHFELEEHSGRFLNVVCIIGAALVATGIALLIAAHWGSISRGIKITLGILLMVAAHAAGWRLRSKSSHHPKIGEALHLIGSCLFLANIALVGQAYNLSSRTPNAFLLWFLGIAALPWILRSKAHHVLALLAFALWFGLEASQSDSLLHLSPGQIPGAFALLGIIYLGCGYLLRSSSFSSFARPTEGLGLLGIYLCTLPMTWGLMDHRRPSDATAGEWIYPVLIALALLFAAGGSSRLLNLNSRWRLSWALSLGGMVALIACARYLTPLGNPFETFRHDNGVQLHWFASAAILGFGLMQIQTALRDRSGWLANFAIVFIAGDIISTYFALLGTLAQTGATFLLTGLFLLGLAWILERNRRSLMKRIRTS